MIGKWTQEWADTSNIPCLYFEKAHSTNDLAKDHVYENIEPLLFITDYQTKGRGRGHNTWESTVAGTSLLASFTFGFSQPPQPITTALIGLALQSSLSNTFPIEIGLKSPNDIYIGNKKLGGILTEVISYGDIHRLIIGIGINVNAVPALDTATSLSQSLSKNVEINDWYRFLNYFFVELTQILAHCTEPQLNDHERHSLLLALKKGPEGQFIQDVLRDGSLETVNGRRPWFDI